jgi:hypothetical protein
VWDQNTGRSVQFRRGGARAASAKSGLSEKRPGGGGWFRSRTTSQSKAAHRVPRANTHEEIYPRTAPSRPVTPTAVVMKATVEIQVPDIDDQDGEGDNRVIGKDDHGVINQIRNEDSDESSDEDSGEKSDEESDEGSDEQSDEQSDEGEKKSARPTIEEVHEGIDEADNEKEDRDIADEAVSESVIPESEFSCKIQHRQSSTLG